jgi:hypothetical protein
MYSTKNSGININISDIKTDLFFFKYNKDLTEVMSIIKIEQKRIIRTKA